MRAPGFGSLAILVSMIAIIVCASRPAMVAADSVVYPAPKPVLLLYNAGMPSVIDDQASSVYVMRLVSKLRGTFDVRNGGAGSSGTASVIEASSLCQTKGINPVGVVVWQLYQQRTTANFILLKHYSTDATIAMTIYRCVGSGDSIHAEKGPDTGDMYRNPAIHELAKSFSAPLLGIIGTGAVADSRIVMSGASKTATIAAVLAGGIPSFTPVSGVSLPDVGANEPKDRASVIFAAIDDAQDWFNNQDCGVAKVTTTQKADPKAIIDIDQAELNAMKSMPIKKKKDHDPEKLLDEVLANEDVLKGKLTSSSSQELVCAGWPADESTK